MNLTVYLFSFGFFSHFFPPKFPAIPSSQLPPSAEHFSRSHNFTDLFSVTAIFFLGVLFEVT